MEVGQKKLQSDKVKISYSTYHKVSNSVRCPLPEGCNKQTYFLHILIFTHLHLMSQFMKCFMFHAKVDQTSYNFSLFKTKTHWVDGGIFKEQTKTNGRKCLQTVSI